MLALVHDYRIMNNNRGWIGYPLINIGLVLPIPLMDIVRCKVNNPNLIRNLILKGDKLTGKEAERLGFVDQSVDPEKLLENAVRLAIEMAPKGSNRSVYGGLKRNLYQTTYTLLTKQARDNPLSWSKL
eukprot:TRINITY_DN1060_c1_g1_i3.p1 TRINITY_DN1060_c1_g1~~TRINITY_DN1060_c1_g1_i3.p1  ORF type:complete len:128 (-),score=23.49 TRINITY_DN1060_c1_g1_i3:160-543(-)